MKVGLYLKNDTIADVDLSQPERGNPGIGGTQYNFITLPYYFQKYIPDQVEFVWYANVIDRLPKSLSSCQVNSASEAISKAVEQNCDMFIWRPTYIAEGIEFLKLVDQLPIKTIAWAHNTPGKSLVTQLYKSVNIQRFVCVSQEQMDRLRWHKIINKTACIFNGFDPKPYIAKEKIQKQHNTVVYLGSIVPGKGFHYLARVWPQIIREKPDAKLVVIGSGKLYNRNQKLGKWGIAAENYEGQWRKYLSDAEGKQLSSVEFKGTLGSEKIAILQNADVGVVNPSGVTENCPGSAIEFQAAGTPVVSGAYRGLLDTVIHQKTGLLGKGDRELTENILYLLDNPDKAKELGDNGIKFISEKFSCQTISNQWLDLFKNVHGNRPNHVPGIQQFPYNDYKIFREGIRKIRGILQKQ